VKVLDVRPEKADLPDGEGRHRLPLRFEDPDLLDLGLEPGGERPDLHSRGEPAVDDPDE
jgi:hypothetical protein